MNKLATGTEQSDWDLYARELIEIDDAALYYDLTQDREISVAVQLGAASNGIAGDGIYSIELRVTIDATGDECVVQQKSIHVPAGQVYAYIQTDPIWLESGTRVKVYVKSSEAADDEVGGMAWVLDRAVTGSGTATVANQTEILDYLKHDWIIDTSGATWKLVVFKQGTDPENSANVLMTKELYTVNGDNIIGTAVPIGQNIEEP